MKRNGPRSRVAIISVLLLGALIFGLVYYSWMMVTDIFKPVSEPGAAKNVVVKVLPGQTTADIAEDLEAKGLIRNALAFRVWARIKGLDTHLQAGVYKKINSSMTIDKIVDELLIAQPDAILVTIPEGWRLEQIAYRFKSSGLTKFDEKKFLEYVKNPARFPDAKKYPLLKSIPAGRSMEGMLFPATYEIPVENDARFVVNEMLKTMSETIQREGLDKLAQQHKMSLYQMLILASIVEREVHYPGDRANIASVYWNRIFKPNDETVGLLQADPTVQYARDTAQPPKTPTSYWSALQAAGGETAADSPWNTYTHKNLPPTPICSPGLGSMKAAAAPPTTDYYYFFAYKDGKGKSKFARTHQEFEQMKQQFGVNNG
jgi:UPF0755 protein